MSELEQPIAVKKHVILPFQHTLLNNHSHYYLGLAGGYGSGKTTFAVHKHHSLCLLNLGCKSWWLASDYAIAFEGFEIYINELKKLGYIENYHFKANRSPGSLKIVYKCFEHEVHFKSANSNLQAASISHLTIDEAGDCREEGVSQAIVRVRDDNAKIPQILFTGAPQGLNHYFKQFNKPDMQAAGEFNQYRFNKDHLIVHFRSWWNTFLPQHAIKALVNEYGHDELTRKSWLYGLFTALTSNAVFKFRNDWHVKPTQYLPHLDHIRLGWDFNVGQVAWTALQKLVDKRENPDPLWRQFAEAPRGCRGTEDACDAFINRFPPSQHRHTEIIVDGDANGYSGDTRGIACDYDIIGSKLKRHYHNLKIIAPHFNDRVQYRALATNRVLNSKRLQIDNSCVQTIDGFNLTTWDLVKGEIFKPSAETFTHYPDGASYVISRDEGIVKRGYIGGAKS